LELFSLPFSAVATAVGEAEEFSWRPFPEPDDFRNVFLSGLANCSAAKVSSPEEEEVEDDIESGKPEV